MKKPEPTEEERKAEVWSDRKALIIWSLGLSAAWAAILIIHHQVF